MANFKVFSRYTNGIIDKNRSGEDFLTLRKPLNLEEAKGDIFVRITQELEQRPDLIAFKAYRNHDLWWAIYEFNNINDPLFDLVQGQTLRLPEKERLLAAIEALGQS